ncbi:hypothetical protein Br6_04965 [Rhodococcus sp. Br-6]|nr:hypothetical protein Br6_04965 [Rhodococcus sp. Br-6]
MTKKRKSRFGAEERIALAGWGATIRYRLLILEPRQAVRIAIAVAGAGASVAAGVVLGASELLPGLMPR